MRKRVWYYERFNDPRFGARDRFTRHTAADDTDAALWTLAGITPELRRCSCWHMARQGTPWGFGETMTVKRECVNCDGEGEFLVWRVIL